MRQLGDDGVGELLLRGRLHAIHWTGLKAKRLRGAFATKNGRERYEDAYRYRAEQEPLHDR